VIGIGPDIRELGETALAVIEHGQVLAGGERHLEFFKDHRGERLVLKGDLKAWLDRVAEAAAEREVVVLASGDPGYYGIAGRLVERLGSEQVLIYPNITVIQAAFARLKRPWDQVKVVSLHGRNRETLWAALTWHDTVAVYTDAVNTPARLGSELAARGQSGWRMCVLEDLGTPEERITECTPEQAAGREFSELNVVIFFRATTWEPPTLGRPDEQYSHQAGLITKEEVRAVAVAKLRLRPNQTLWDLGAGCGAVGLEASALLWRGRVVAVERNPDRAALIQENQRKFGAANLEVVLGELPGVMDGLPAPDRIFVGGGGSALEAIVRRGVERLSSSGIMVVSAVQLSSLEIGRATMADSGLSTEVVQIQVNRGRRLGSGEYLQALNPVWLITGLKSQVVVEVGTNHG
jgi:precorrin-6Y C5,15-methyltransferase (decarboxylating)